MIYELAAKEKRIVVTQDYDFKKFVKAKKAGVFLLPPYLNSEQMDILLSDFIRDKKPEDFSGKVTKVA